MVFELIQSINGDCDFSSSVNESSYTEKIKVKKQTYFNFLFCILDNYDLSLSCVSNEDKKHYFKQRVLGISASLDENTEEFYDSMSYNPKTMKKKIIQRSLHGSIEKDKNISSIYYLNDLYKTHFVLVDLIKREYYETTIKNYDKVYLCMNKNRFCIQDNLPNNVIQKDINESIFTIDVKTVYKTYLDPISKYKIGDLKETATNLAIPLSQNGKNKTKNILYDEINMIKMNN